MAWNTHLVNDDGSPMDFPQAVTAILVEEQGQTQEAAKAMMVRHPQIVTNGIMGGFNYRATAMALLMKEGDE